MAYLVNQVCVQEEHEVRQLMRLQMVLRTCGRIGDSDRN